MTFEIKKQFTIDASTDRVWDILVDQFDGDDDYIEIGDPDAVNLLTGDTTLNTWVRARSNTLNVLSQLPTERH